MKSHTIGAVCAIALIWSVSTATSASIIYHVNRTVGDGIVVGTIETNGTIGGLALSDIVSWSFDLSDGVDTGSVSSTSNMINLSGPLNLSATTTELTYDFSGPADGWLEFTSETNLPDQNAWVYSLVNHRASPTLATEAIAHSDDSQGLEHLTFTYNSSDTQIIGSVVPVPASIWLFGSGLLGLVGLIGMAR